MNEQQMKAFFLLAGLNVQAFWKLENRYWPDNEHYAEVRRDSPWWLVQTPRGNIVIGWRKRVIVIDWEATGVAAEITTDDVTKDKHLVHAYSHVKCLEYLTALRKALDKPLPVEATGAPT